MPAEFFLLLYQILFSRSIGTETFRPQSLWERPETNNPHQEKEGSDGDHSFERGRFILPPIQLNLQAYIIIGRNSLLHYHLSALRPSFLKLLA